MTTQRLTLQAITELARNALQGAGAKGKQLDIAAQSIVDAECDGIRTVGLNYLPIYCGHLQHGKLNPDAQPTHTKSAPSVITSHADNGFAHAAFVEAEADFCQLTATQGIAALNISQSYSAGVVGWFVQRLAEQGLIAIGCANSPSAVAPTAEAGAFFGTNPLAFALPRRDKPVVIADMATSQVALVTVKKHAANNQPIPLGWGYDAQGQETTDAKAVINGGTLAPMGGYKGVLLGLLVDVLAGVLAGPHCSYQAPMFKNNEGSYPNTGQFFIAIAPGNISGNAYQQRLEMMLAALAQEPGTRLPGERRHQFRQKAITEGIDVPTELIQTLQGFAKKLF